MSKNQEVKDLNVCANSIAGILVDAELLAGDEMGPEVDGALSALNRALNEFRSALAYLEEQ